MGLKRWLRLFVLFTEYQNPFAFVLLENLNFYIRDMPLCILLKLQNRAARVLTFSNYDCSTSELFQNLKWSKLVHQRVVSKAIMVHSIVNNTVPEYLTSRFVRRCDDLTSYNLRENEYKLAVPQPRTEFYKRSLSIAEVSYGTACLWRCGN